jgi:hypothetical protein
MKHENKMVVGTVVLAFLLIVLFGDKLEQHLFGFHSAYFPH